MQIADTLQAEIIVLIIVSKFTDVMVVSLKETLLIKHDSIRINFCEGAVILFKRRFGNRLRF